jgi:ABC-type glutathione transport system ATPase component
VGTAAETSLKPPAGARTLLTRLQERRDLQLKAFTRIQNELAATDEGIRLAPEVSKAIEALQGELFRALTSALETNLSIALQEVLEQAIVFKARPVVRRNQLEIDFCIERSGQPEDIIRGQGGSVANVLSVGLRIFALTTLDPALHRRFLLLDEQDCWLRPDLVPRLVKIVHDAGKALGFQVILISHHDAAALRPYADRIYTFTPDAGDGVLVTREDD